MQREILQILPQPQVLPKKIAWLIYFVISTFLIVAIVIVLITAPKKKPKKQDFIENEESENIPKPKMMDNKPVMYNSFMRNSPQPFGFITLEEVSAYQCNFEPSIKSISWLEKSDDEIFYKDFYGKPWLINISNGTAYPYVEEKSQPDDIFKLPFNKNEHRNYFDEQSIDNKESTLKDVNKYDRRAYDEEQRVDDDYHIVDDRYNDGFVEEYNNDKNDDEMLVSRNMATLWNCYENGKDEEECQFNAYFMSYAEQEEPLPFSLELVSYFSQIVGNRSGDYTYINDERQGEGSIRRFRHRQEYRIQLLAEKKNRPSTNACVIKSIDMYKFIWANTSFEPKHTTEVTESCPKYELTWRDEFTFDPYDSRFHLDKPKLPTTTSYFTTKKQNPVSFSPYRFSTFPQGWQNQEFDRHFQNYFDDISIDRRRLQSIGLNKRSATTVQGSKKLARTRPTLRHADVPSTTADIKRHVLLSTRQQRNTCNGSSSSTDFVKIGKTGWILHAILQKRPDGRIIFNMALSREETYTKLRSIPEANEIFKPLLHDDLWVTQILAAPVVGADEALAYFIAAPLTYLSHRYLYRVKIVYPPLEYSTLEPIKCLTCIEKVNPDNSNYELSSPGKHPQCDWAEVLMSNNALNYILECRGEEVPWNVVVSSSNNLVLRRLNNHDDHRSEYGNITRPSTYDFKLNLEDGFQIKARLYLPPDWKDDETCRNKLTLILKIPEKQNDQLIDAQYDLSLTTYLTTFMKYAVLYADVRASKFNSLNVINLKYRQREIMQIEDYVRIVKHGMKEFKCIDEDSGIGVLGEAYGGHVALNLIAKEDNGRKNIFRCAAAIRPYAPWQAYVYPFNRKTSGSTIESFRRKMYKSRYLSPLVRRLRNKNFSIYTSSPDNCEDTLFYTDSLLGLLDRQNLNYVHRNYDDETVYMCGSRFSMYHHVVEFFEDCFHGWLEKK